MDLKDVSHKIEFELRTGRNYFVSWGKKVIRALDHDDAMKLVRIFSKTGDAAQSADNEPLSDIDGQVEEGTGYGGYVWTAWLHNWMGDTCLHMAIKMKRRRCVWALLLLGAKTDIPNDKGLTAQALCKLPEYLNEDISRVAGGARKRLMESVDPRTMDGLPDSFVLRGILDEAWYLMEQGRQTYVELPNCMLPDSDPNKVKVEDDAGEIKGANRAIMAQFSQNDVVDVSRIIKTQMGIRKVRERGNMEKSSGLSLLNDVRKNMPRMSASVKRTFRDSALQKLTFIKRGRGYFDSLTSDAPGDGGDDEIAPIDPETAALKDRSTKEITVYSTRSNMKYMRVANYGARLLADAMVGNSIIVTLILANARISDPGVEDLCRTLPTMTSITFLDLSGNAITNKGADSTVAMLRARHGRYGGNGTNSLEKLSLAANRMNDLGVEKLMYAAHDYGVRFMGLHNQRKSTRAGREAIQAMHDKLIEEGRARQVDEAVVQAHTPSLGRGGSRGSFASFAPSALRRDGKGVLMSAVKEDCNVIIMNPMDLSQEEVLKSTYAFFDMVQNDALEHQARARRDMDEGSAAEEVESAANLQPKLEAIPEELKEMHRHS